MADDHRLSKLWKAWKHARLGDKSICLPNPLAFYRYFSVKRCQLPSSLFFYEHWKISQAAHDPTRRVQAFRAVEAATTVGSRSLTIRAGAFRMPA